MTASASPSASQPSASQHSASQHSASQHSASQHSASQHSASQHSASRNARERARAEITREIKQEARRQVAAHGAPGLSLRAVARELGMVSSALYRYFPSRDELLTALIIDAYDALGQAAETSGAGLAAADTRGRWRALCTTIRAWALAHPHEYALIYGSPVPGYRAPQATIAPAIRAARVFGRIIADANRAHAISAHATSAHAIRAHAIRGDGTANDDHQALPPAVAGQASVVAEAIAPGTPGPVIARGLVAWTQLFGMISFELFGQLAGSVDPADEFFSYAVEQMADFAGLPAASGS